jgi:3-hydroxy-3-methylglutaryl CoA synthase
MFPYVEACRKVGVLELDCGDVVDLRWDGTSERPIPAPPGHGSRRCIVIRVNRAWHGYAEKVVISPMKQDVATASTPNGKPPA